METGMSVLLKVVYTKEKSKSVFRFLYLTHCWRYKVGGLQQTENAAAC